MKPYIAIVCLLVSCASPQDESAVAAQVQYSGASKYDGDWRALMQDTESVQQVEGYRFDCAPFTESFFLRVRGGVAAGFLEADENYSFTAPLDRKGRFKALIPTSSAYTYKDAAIERQSNIVLVLQGELAVNKKSGQFVIGDAAVDSRGCVTRVQFVAL